MILTTPYSVEIMMSGSHTLTFVSNQFINTFHVFITTTYVMTNLAFVYR